MHLHSIHHVPFEGLGRIADWAEARKWTRSATWQHRGDAPPDLDGVDLLVVTGGPMSVGDEAVFPWLTAEKALIREALDRKVPVLGICLGAQLIAEVLGAKVAPMGHREIGWCDMRKTPEARALPWLDVFPNPMPALHWHGEQFGIPSGATPLWSSDACAHQGFLHGSALALQFHLEMGGEDLAALVENARGELSPAGRWVQSEAALLGHPGHFTRALSHMNQLLDLWLGHLG